MKRINLEDLKQAITEYLEELDDTEKGEHFDTEKQIQTNAFQNFLIFYERKYNPKLKKLRERKIEIEKEIEEMEENLRKMETQNEQFLKKQVKWKE